MAMSDILKIYDSANTGTSTTTTTTSGTSFAGSTTSTVTKPYRTLPLTLDDLPEYIAEDVAKQLVAALFEKVEISAEYSIDRLAWLYTVKFPHCHYSFLAHEPIIANVAEPKP